METMRRSLTWMLAVADRGPSLPNSPVAVSWTVYGPWGRSMRGSSPLRGVECPWESETVHENVVVGWIPTDCEASSCTPKPSGGLTYSGVLGRSGAPPWAGSGANWGTIDHRMTAAELRSERMSSRSTV